MEPVHQHRQLRPVQLTQRPDGAVLIATHQTRFAHVMDTRPCDNARMLARNVDILLCEATYCESEAKQAHEYMHLTARQAAEIARDSHVGKLVLTHFSQRYLTLNTLLQEAREVFPNTQLAHDCQHIPFPKRKRGMGE